VAEVEFGLLGPLAVRRDGAAVAIAAGRQRALLAVLLVNAGRVVGTDELIEVLWDAIPPASARASLHNYVRRLRQALGDDGHHRISTRPHGYMISVEPDGLDVDRFQALEDAARAAARAGAWEAAAGALRDALALWRGHPLADVDSAVLRQREVPRLVEMRLRAVEARIDADLNLGSHDELVAELQSLAAKHPLRERFPAQLMLALYRCGRQAEALTAYQHARQALVEELGTEPGPELQDLHQRRLSADPALAVTESVLPAAAGPARITPRELPSAVPGFVGRPAELLALSGLLDRSGTHGAEATAISAIGGTAGVGKTNPRANTSDCYRSWAVPTLWSRSIATRKRCTE
jgi:DNA-binding SARP family transcriptional activator